VLFLGNGTRIVCSCALTKKHWSADYIIIVDIVLCYVKSKREVVTDGFYMPSAADYTLGDKI